MSKKPHNGWQRFFYEQAVFMIRHRTLCILLTCVFTIFFIFQLKFIQMDNSNEIWFEKKHKDASLLEKFNRVFGNDDYILITAETGTDLVPETIRLVRKLAEDLKASVPYAKDVTWLGWLPRPFQPGDFGVPELFFDAIPKTADLLKRDLNLAAGNPLYVNQYISPDKTILGLFVQMKSYPSNMTDPRKKVFPALKKIFEKQDYKDLILHAAGGPVLDYEFDTIVVKEMILFIGLIICVMAVVLIWLGRGIRGILVPLATVSLSILWTLGFMSFIGLKLNLLTIMIPILLATAGIANSIHIIVAFQDQWDQGHERLKSLRNAVSMVGFPCLLTSITTAIGFLSFLAAPIPPFREMGIYAATGMIMGFLITFTLVVCLFSYGKPQKTFTKKTHVLKDAFGRFLSFTFQMNTRFSKSIVLFFLVVSAVCLYGMTKVEFESNFIEMFSKKVTFRQNYHYVDEHMGGAMALEIMVNTGKPDGVKDPEFIQKLERFQGAISRHPLTAKATSFLDLLRMMGMFIQQTPYENVQLPDFVEEIKQYFNYYKMMTSQGMSSVISRDFSSARVTVRTKSLGTQDVRRFLKYIESVSKPVFQKDVIIETTGYMAWIKTLNDQLHQGLYWSFSLAFIGILIIMSMVLKSIRLGMISMLPNIVPVLVVLGSMGLTGYNIDIPLMCIAAIVIGISVDDSVHFFIRFKNEFKLEKTYEGALKNTLIRVGRPITYTTLILVIGLILLVFSSINAFIKFGILTSLAFTWALLADLFLGPCLLLLLKPFGPEKTDLKES